LSASRTSDIFTRIVHWCTSIGRAPSTDK